RHPVRAGRGAVVERHGAAVVALHRSAAGAVPVHRVAVPLPDLRLGAGPRPRPRPAERAGRPAVRGPTVQEGRFRVSLSHHDTTRTAVRATPSWFDRLTMKGMG